MFSRPKHQSDTASPDKVNPVNITLDDLVRERFAPGVRTSNTTRGLSGFPGPVRTNRRGQGFEFDDLRQYVEGDDLRHADWNVTARTGRLHVRLFREERERVLTVAVDLRPVMFTGSTELRAVTACLVAARILWRAAANGDRCAATVFDGSEFHMSKPASGDRGALSGCNLIAQAFRTASMDKEARSDDLLPLLEYASAARRHAGYIAVVSGLDGLNGQAADLLAEAGHRERMAAIRIVDPVELDGLPPGYYTYLDGNTSQSVTLSRATSRHLRITLERDRANIRDMFGRNYIPFIEARADDWTGFEHDAAMIGL